MAINRDLVDEIERRVVALTEEVTHAERVVVRIPDWKPVDLKEGLHWLECSLAEGYFVRSRVDWAGRDATIWMKLWEHPDSKPDWDAGEYDQNV